MGVEGGEGLHRQSWKTWGGHLTQPETIMLLRSLKEPGLAVVFALERLTHPETIMLPRWLNEPGFIVLFAFCCPFAFDLGVPSPRAPPIQPPRAVCDI